jgi:hypothetical protein
MLTDTDGLRILRRKNRQTDRQTESVTTHTKGEKHKRENTKGKAKFTLAGGRGKERKGKGREGAMKGEREGEREKERGEDDL